MFCLSTSLTFSPPEKSQEGTVMGLGLIIQHRSQVPPGGWPECSGMGGRNHRNTHRRWERNSATKSCWESNVLSGKSFEAGDTVKFGLGNVSRLGFYLLKFLNYLSENLEFLKSLKDWNPVETTHLNSININHLNTFSIV